MERLGKNGKERAVYVPENGAAGKNGKERAVRAESGAARQKQ